LEKKSNRECSLSLSLFNLGIDIFITNIRENYQECVYNYDGQLRKVIQAYADDLLVFADIRNHMNILVDRFEDFMKYEHINFNPNKCKILIHNPEKEMIVQVQLPNEKGELQDIGICGIKNIIKYLGVTLGTRKLQKMKINKCRIEKTVKILERLRYSGLEIPQAIDAMKRFVLPRLDYPMMNNVIGVIELSEPDKFDRNVINKMEGGPALSKNIFYTANKNEGFGLRLLTER
jgi:hypothetical protein